MLDLYVFSVRVSSTSVISEHQPGSCSMQ